MQDGNQEKSTKNKWADSTIGGRFATPFSEEELGVPFGLPSRLTSGPRLGQSAAKGAKFAQDTDTSRNGSIKGSRGD